MNFNNLQQSPPSPGVRFNEFGEATIVVWAPETEQAYLLIMENQEKIPLKSEFYGYWTLTTSQFETGRPVPVCAG
jgi:maltooligosyltrehalose trehalohydrolase